MIQLIKLLPGLEEDSPVSKSDSIMRGNMNDLEDFPFFGTRGTLR
jgi:hypothetical protein